MKAVIEGAGAVAAVVVLFLLWAAVDELRMRSRWRNVNHGAMNGVIVAIYVTLPLPWPPCGRSSPTTCSRRAPPSQATGSPRFDVRRVAARSGVISGTPFCRQTLPAPGASEAPDAPDG
jgi:hypothetical protein